MRARRRQSLATAQLGALRDEPAAGLALALCVSRALFGAVLMAAPRRSASGWVGEFALDRRAALLTRSLGARDVALGAGGAAAVLSSDGAPGWLAAQALSDVADLAGTLSTRDLLPQSGVRATTALAGVSALVSAFCAARLR